MSWFRNIRYVAVVALCGVMLAACSKPKIIPDEELAEIFRDAFLSNAYTQLHRPPNLDSLNIYEPLFAKYGYTAEDLQFTIGNFAKRKNARMTDVVDKTIEMLSASSNTYKRRLAISDSIGNVLRERFAKVVYTDTLIEVRRIADTARLRIVIPTTVPGNYDVSYYYFVDSEDMNHDLRVNHYLVDENGKKLSMNSRRLRRADQDRFTATFTALPTHRKLVLDLNGYAAKDELTRPRMTIDSLVVTRYLPDRVARDSVARERFDYRRIDTLAYPRRGWPRADSVVYIIRPDSTFFLSKPRANETLGGTPTADS